MGKEKQQQPNPPAGQSDGGDELAGSTLEDYFATHKGSGHVSQHLLNIPTENDVMAAEKIKQDSKRGPDGKFAKEAAGTDQESEQDEYEDDYESASSTPKGEPPSEVAGMSLSDYLHVKEDDNAQAKEKLSRAGSQRVLPPQLAAAPKKNAPVLDVSGMSLDHYLGAAIGDKKSEEKADKKSSPKVKQKGSKTKQNTAAISQGQSIQQSFSAKGSGIIHGSHANSSSQNLSSDEENGPTSSPSSSLTPFQRRQKRKDKAKSKQQRNAGGGPSISKAILMAEASSPSTNLSVRDREKRKSSYASAHSHHPGHPGHHGSHSSTSSSQSPLPKLAVSPSVRSLGHKDHDVENSDDTAEKLPPL